MVKKQQKETNNVVSVSVGAASPKERFTGKNISINLKATTYFGVGDIWLSPERYWVEVPGNLSNEDYEIIEKSLAKGTIILGKTFIPPVDKASNIKEKYWLLIKNNGFETKEAKSKFTDLVRRGHDSGWTAIEIAQYCLDQENSAKKRKNVINLLSQLITQYRGPIQLYDPPDDAEGIKKITINADGSVEAETNSGKKVANKIETTPPKDHIPGNKSTSDAVNELFN